MLLAIFYGGETAWKRGALLMLGAKAWSSE